MNVEMENIHYIVQVKQTNLSWISGAERLDGLRLTWNGITEDVSFGRKDMWDENLTDEM